MNISTYLKGSNRSILITLIVGTLYRTYDRFQNQRKCDSVSFLWYAILSQTYLIHIVFIVFLCIFVSVCIISVVRLHRRNVEKVFESKQGVLEELMLIVKRAVGKRKVAVRVSGEGEEGATDVKREKQERRKM